MSVSGSIRDTVPSLRLATQTAPAPTATPLGPLPTGILASGVPDRGSSRMTLAVSSLATQIAPAPAASADGRPPTSIALRDLAARQVDPRDGGVDRGCDPDRAGADGDGVRGVADLVRPCTTLLSCGSTWVTVRPWPSATHNEPAPKASPVGSPPTGIVATSRRARVIRETVPSSRLATHTEPAPAAIAPGSRPTLYWAVIRPLPASISPTVFASMAASPVPSSPPNSSAPPPATASAARAAAASRPRSGRRARAGAPVAIAR